MYKVMKIRKRSQFPNAPVRYRILEEPDPVLKVLQKKLLKKMQLLANTAPLPNICGFMGPHTGTAQAASFHTGAKYLLQMDIKNFFGTVNERMVRISLMNWLCLSPAVAEAIAKICVKDDHLPQGAPCSSYLANIAAMDMYCHLYEYAEAAELQFSVYVDDMYFSSDDREKLECAISGVKEILSRYGFSLTEEKVRLSKPGQRQQVMDVCVARVENWPVQLQRLSRRERHRVFNAIHNLKVGKDTHSIHHVMGLVNNARRVKDPHWLTMAMKFEEARKAWQARQANRPDTNLKELAKRRIKPDERPV